MDDLKVGLKLGLISLCVECVSITRTCCDTKMGKWQCSAKDKLGAITREVIVHDLLEQLLL